MYVHPVRIDPGLAFARFCTVCPCQPRSFGWFAQPVVSRGPQTQKGAEQAPGIPPRLKTFFLPVFSLDQDQAIASSFPGNEAPQKTVFEKKASRGSWASEAPGSRPAASQPPACPVSSAGPPRCRCPAAPAAPASAGSPGPPCCGPHRTEG